MARQRAGLLGGLLAGLLMLTASAQAGTATGKVSCPASWPAGSGSVLRYADFSTKFGHNPPLDFDAQPSPYWVRPGDELACAYTNNRRLLITVPGKPDTCYVAQKRKPKPGTFDSIVYCTFDLTGDATKDTIHIREMEPLTRATVLRGIHIGMSPDEVAHAIRPGTKTQDLYDQNIFLLADKEQLTVEFTPNVSMIGFRPPLGKVTGLFDEMLERFGFPDELVSQSDIAVWYGDGVRLVIFQQHLLGNLLFSDEEGFLIGFRSLSDLDKQIKSEFRYF